VGLVHLEGKTVESTRELFTELMETNTRIDYYCWDLYARVSQWYTASTDAAELAARKQLRLDTLHALEAGGNETAVIADLVSTSVLRRHLETMERLGIEYDFLPRESEILHLHFWETARALMVERGVLYLETEGKNKGCWVMRRAISAAAGVELAEQGPDEDAKIIVRSNGTVTYVGKDIAYHLWKYGLLGKDFGYAKFHEYATHTCWISTTHGENPHPSFGHADAIYNVIDSRQDDPQTQVKESLRALSYVDESERYTHLNYAFVGLTARTAEDLGYVLSEEDKAKNFIEVSGRKGFGVKADDLIDRMIAAARKEVEARHPELEEAERAKIAEAIGVGALRFFLLRFTRSTVIAFDFEDALSFEGETGPYVQYAVVRVNGILRKGAEMDPAVAIEDATNLAKLRSGEIDAGKFLGAPADDDIWDLVVLAASLDARLEVTLTSLEPNFLTRFAFELAQMFNVFYHKHHILKEVDPEKRAFLLQVTALVRAQLVTTLGILGITAPEKM